MLKKDMAYLIVMKREEKDHCLLEKQKINWLDQRQERQ